MPAGTRIITHPLKVEPKKDYDAHRKRIWGTGHNKDQGWIKCGLASLRKFFIFSARSSKRSFLPKVAYFNVLHLWLTLALSGSISGSLWLTLALSSSLWLFLSLAFSGTHLLTRSLLGSRTKLLPYTNFYVAVLTQFWIKLLHVGFFY